MPVLFCVLSSMKAEVAIGSGYSEMQLGVRRATTAGPVRLSRGQWCNLCGARLSSTGLHHTPAFGHQRQISWLDAAGKISVWSLCVQCYNLRLRCSACNMQVGSEGVMLEGERGVYCGHCFESRPRCDTCGRPVGPHYWSRPDGRKLCDRCQSTAVSDAQYAHALYRRVRAALDRELGLSLHEPCQLKLVNRRQLAGLIDKSSLYSLDAASRDRCFGLFMREGRHRAIFVEYGLPQMVLMEVMAHEFAHAWQSEQCPGDLPQETQEGFAEWMAYKLLEGWGCWKRIDRMLRREDIYGRGLRMVLQWEQAEGQAGVIRRVKRGSET